MRLELFSLKLDKTFDSSLMVINFGLLNVKEFFNAML